VEREENYKLYTSLLDDAHAVVRNIQAYSAVTKGVWFTLRGGRRAYREGDMLLGLLKEASTEVRHDYSFGRDISERKNLVEIATQAALEYRKKFYWVLLKAIREDRDSAVRFIPQDISRLEAFLELDE